MTVIWKYELKRLNNVISMPKNASVLNVGEQLNECCIWAAVNPNNEYSKRTFKIVFTGEDFNTKGLCYIGSCRIHKSDLMPLVCHVYEDLNND